MQYTNINNERAVRIKYIRTLEKFFQISVALLRKENLTFETFTTKTLRNKANLEKTKEIEVTSNYLKEVTKFKDMMIFCLQKNEKNFKEEVARISKFGNTILRDKNNTTYKKQKHKKKIFNEEY